MEKIFIRLTLAAAIFFLMPALSGLAEEGGPPPVRKIPGITAEDTFPRACVDCHINRPDMNMDVRISTILREWSEKVPPKFLAKAQAATPAGVKLAGKHPAVAGALKDIPAGCLACHGETSKTAPPFGRLMHLYHLTGGDENPFLSVFQGECANCHKLDQATGVWSVPGGPEK